MVQQGFDAWWPSERLAVWGLFEVLRHYREIVGIRRQLKTKLLASKPDVFIGVDAPDFNFDLERDLKAQGVRTVHFVCPSIWAWRAKRVQTIAQSADHVLCIFPFEVDLLEQHGIQATYVGHPLAQMIPSQVDQAAARQQLGLAPERPVVALLPGSREGELRHLTARFIQAAQQLKQQRAQLQFVLPAIPKFHTLIASLVEEAGGLNDLHILQGQSHTALAACDVTLIASGTATLEAALFKRPMVIAYHMHPLSWWMTRRKMLQPWVGLPNILANEFIVPELIQEQATPQALAQHVAHWLDSPQQCAQVKQRFEQMHQDLLRDTEQLATDAIQKILKS
jgi:lipid-A-disaccharide synthase